MRLSSVLCAFVGVTLGLGVSSFAAAEKRGYVLRDTTSLPPPAPGLARLVVARDMRIMRDLKPEFGVVDGPPVGILPQRTAVTGEITPGWHRVRLGRGGGSEVWMEFVPDGRYLLRLRESTVSGTGNWRGDLVREGADGYAEFALSKGMKLAVMDARGKGALERNLGKPSETTQKQDSTGRVVAIGKAAWPIVIEEAWSLPLPSEAAQQSWELHPGKITLDEKSLRFTRADTLVVEIARDSVTEVHLGPIRGNVENPWIKIGFRGHITDPGVTVADATLSTATENYNRQFPPLVK